MRILIALLCFIQFSICAEQHTHSGSMEMTNENVPAFNATGDEPMSFALFPDNKSYFYIHVTMMVISFWVLMPIGIMFGIARSSLHMPVQFLSFCFALVGFFFAKLYGHATPHLYKGNSHHTLGWILFIFMVVQMSVGVVRKIANAVERKTNNDYERIQEREHFLNHPSSSDRHSEASGETLNMNEFNEFDKHRQDPIASPSLITRAFNKVPQFVKNGFRVLAYNPLTTVVCRYFHQIMGRTFIVLIFVQTLSGMVVYHGVCRSWEVLGCIAHLIKGGIFFFYGCVTFGRYLGAFANRGWAWNRVEEGSSYSFEMIESGLIFVYGVTNTWMEHFGQDAAWTHKDLEHASLAFMWWWGGLAGLLVESRAIRRLLQRAVHQGPLTGYSLNPFPALIVLMTGISMGNHHQDTAYSTNVHSMWGLLLASAAVCRFITYVALYRNEPQDAEPSRPPSEIVGAFLLIAGSILFMASNSGTLLWLRRENVDSMFLMNVCVALTSMTLSYVAALMIIKAWSEKREDLKKQPLF